MYRLQNMPMGSLVKSVFNELESLHQQGFNTWVTKVTELTKLYGIVLHGNFTSFKSQCKSRVIEHFLNDWKNELNSEDKPILRTYRMFKHNFESEKYLHNVLDDRYRTAIAKLRTSSHVLEIERGRHAKPKIATHLRNCTVCHTIEDEEHFVTACDINESERKELHRKIENIYPLFKNMNERQMFLYLMSNKDRQVQKWFGKFIYHSFITRNHRVLLNVKLYVSLCIWVICATSCTALSIVEWSWMLV